MSLTHLRDRIGYGMYGGTTQHYVKGVDGAVAQLGSKAPGDDDLLRVIQSAERQHNTYVRRVFRENGWGKPPIVEITQANQNQ